MDLADYHASPEIMMPDKYASLSTTIDEAPNVFNIFGFSLVSNSFNN